MIKILETEQQEKASHSLAEALRNLVKQNRSKAEARAQANQRHEDKAITPPKRHLGCQTAQAEKHPGPKNTLGQNTAQVAKRTTLNQRTTFASEAGALAKEVRKLANVVRKLANVVRPNQKNRKKQKNFQ